MNLDRIKEFYYVARAANITRAAQELNISQPALSRSMQLFEHHLGINLFLRCPRGIKLTSEGEKIYEFACRIIEEANLIGKTIRANDLEGNVTVALSTYLSGTWLIKKLKNYLRDHSHIRLKVLDQVLHPKAGEVDIMIGFELPNTSDFIKHVLLRSEIGLFASAAYLKKSGTPQDLDDLDDHFLISYSECHKLPYKEKNPWILKAGKDYGRHRQPHLKVSSLEGLLRAVCDDLGIAELPRGLKEIKEKGLVPVLPHLTGPEIELSLAYPQELKGRATIQSLKGYLANNALN